MGKKTLYGLLIGLGFSIFVLANSHGARIPIVAFPLFYVYGIGFVFGWEKMKGSLAHACGVATSVDYWLLIALFFRRNGILWGVCLFLLYIGFAITFGIWYGLFLFCAGIIKKFLPSANEDDVQSVSNRQAQNSWPLWAGFLVVFCGIGLVTWNYWPQIAPGKTSSVARTNSSSTTTTGGHKRLDEHEMRQPVGRQVSPQPRVGASQQSTQSSQKVPEWKKTFPLKPGTSAYGLLEGQWQGDYLIGRKERNLHLQISKNKDGSALAIFTFDTSKKSKVKNVGQFYLTCKYNPQENYYLLISAGWIKRIGDYRMVNMRGSISNRKFIGNIIDMDSSKEIGTFELTKIRN